MIALMREAAKTSETLVKFYQTTRRYNPEDSHLESPCCLHHQGDHSPDDGGNKDL
jgi:hypothetical protein